MNNWKKKFDKELPLDTFVNNSEYGSELKIKEVKGFIESLLQEQRKEVLDEVKIEVEKELEKWDESAEELEDGWGNYTVCLPWELKEKKADISTFINQLKLK